MRNYYIKNRRKFYKQSNYIISRFSSLCFFTIFIVVVILFLFIYMFEQRILPSLMDISHIRSKTIANQILDTSLQELLIESPIESSDFMSIYENQVTINSQSINHFCSNLSLRLSEKAEDLPKEIISIPIGSVTQLNFFEEFGPSVPFQLFPIGLVTSDYETEFTSTGINQTNYKIWIYVSIEIQIVNPFYTEAVTMNKKIMLVDTIIRGDVPEQYFSIDPNNTQ